MRIRNEDFCSGERILLLLSIGDNIKIIITAGTTRKENTSGMCINPKEYSFVNTQTMTTSDIDSMKQISRVFA
jgi:hypothetical protein